MAIPFKRESSKRGNMSRPYVWDRVGAINGSHLNLVKGLILSKSDRTSQGHTDPARFDLVYSVLSNVTWMTLHK